MLFCFSGPADHVLRQRLSTWLDGTLFRSRPFLVRFLLDATKRNYLGKIPRPGKVPFGSAPVANKAVGSQTRGTLVLLFLHLNFKLIMQAFPRIQLLWDMVTTGYVSCGLNPRAVLCNGFWVPVQMINFGEAIPTFEGLRRINHPLRVTRYPPPSQPKS